MDRQTLLAAAFLFLFVGMASATPTTPSNPQYLLSLQKVTGSKVGNVDIISGVLYNNATATVGNIRFIVGGDINSVLSPTTQNLTTGASAPFSINITLPGNLSSQTVSFTLLASGDLQGENATASSQTDYIYILPTLLEASNLTTVENTTQTIPNESREIGGGVIKAVARAPTTTPLPANARDYAGLLATSPSQALLGAYASILLICIGAYLYLKNRKRSKKVVPPVG